MNSSHTSAKAPSGLGGGPDASILRIFAKLDPIALGVGLGVLCGAGLFVATLVLVLKGGPVIGPRLQLLGQYLIGYSVTLKGSLIGLVYGFVLGFILGWATAFLRNLLLDVYLHTVKLRARLSSIHDYLDPP